MKCVINDNMVERVSDDKADYLVEKMGYSYCPKKLWKNSLENQTRVLNNKPRLSRVVKKGLE